MPIRSAAHPRSRGENVGAARHEACETGSSPLTRGKPMGRRVWCWRLGLIPAHAGKTEGSDCECTHVWAHPRSRGENRRAGGVTCVSCGSSPLTRGKRLPEEVPGRYIGLIPAHAGKTGGRPIRRCGRRAHPRSRGENDATDKFKSTLNGSSPLTRGKHFLTCAFTAQIDQILETLELAVSSESYSIWVACATDAPQDQVRSIGLVLPSSRGAS